jgi:hypothetical protein
LASAYIQIATVCPQALRRELLAYQEVIVLLGIHSRLIGPGASNAEVKFLAKPPEISEVSPACTVQTIYNLGLSTLYETLTRP